MIAASRLRSIPAMLVMCALIAFSTSGSAAGLQPIPASAPKCAQPEQDQLYPLVDPARLGINPERLRAALQYGTQLLSTSVRVYRYGCLAGQSVVDPVSEFAPFPLASASKGVLSLAVGRAVTMGYLKLDDPIGKYIPEADAAHGALTVRTLLQQLSGLRLVAADEIAAIATDPVQATLDQPFWYLPGAEYMYGQSVLATLAHVVGKATGMDYQTFVQRELMGRVGIPRNHWIWLRDRSGGTIAAGGLLMRPNDQAKLGHLMLYKGKWGSQQLISQSYLEEAVHGTAPNPGYGFLFWTNEGDWHKVSHIGRPKRADYELLPGSPRDTYGAMGALGQMIINVPSRHLVIVRNGGPGGGLSTIESLEMKELVRRLVDSVDDAPRIPDPGIFANYPAGSSIDDALIYLNILDWNVLGILTGVGDAGLPNCNIIFCNGRFITQDLAAFGGDTLLQFIGAAGGTIEDKLRGRRYSPVIYP